MTELSFRFRKCERLKDKKEIQRLFKEGKKCSCEGAKLFFQGNHLSYNRVVFTCARNYGNAVQRNYSRRLSREAYRLMKHQLFSGYDIVVLIYPGKDEFQERLKQLQVLFKKAGLLRRTE
ncbi:MAG TPA: ribonuclease P protein component [Termitinemataceae bacterium]|nr:ribonuclease P protein component [Termitinemataceae bacterium]HOM22204.1 ribonuclease P protein component [Termitinemataceae bacterium]HPP99374.1 ribonuclease P protein component [Termitinemataceae bacterium]